MLNEYTLSAGSSVSEYQYLCPLCYLPVSVTFLELKLNVKSEVNLFIRKSTAQDYRLNKVDKENGHLPINVTTLLKNPTNALMCVNTTLFTLLHCYMFQPSRGHP